MLGFYLGGNVTGQVNVLSVIIWVSKLKAIGLPSFSTAKTYIRTFLFPLTDTAPLELFISQSRIHSAS